MTAAGMIFDGALWAAESNGWRVHPVWGMRDGVCACPLGAACKPKQQGKHPILGEWQKLATADSAAIIEWWEKYPEANLGIASGRASGFFVFDVDGEDGRASLAKLEAEHGPLPETLRARSGRGDGGVHYYFLFPESQDVRNKQSLYQGIDVRGDGGFAIGAPSLHRSGKRYEWLNTSTQLAPAPEWLLKALKPKDYAPAPAAPLVHTDQTKKAIAYLAKMPGAISGSGGHDATYKAAVILVKGFALSVDQAFAILSSEYNPRCQPPWTEKELRHKVSDAARSNTLPEGFIANRPAKHLRAVPSDPFASFADFKPSSPMPMDGPPPPSDDDLPPEAILQITAAELDRLLEDDKAAAVTPGVFERLIAMQAIDRAEWERINNILLRHHVKRGFNDAIKRHDRDQKKQRMNPRGEEWKNSLLFKENKAGDLVLENCLSNIIAVLQNDPAWVGVLAFDDFLTQIVTLRAPPYNRLSKRWADEDSLEVKSWIEINYPVRPNTTIVNEAIIAVAKRSTFSGLKKYFDELPKQDHDSDPLIDDWLVQFFGTEDNPYVRAVGKKWLISAVARALDPGCKVDTVLILEGQQGMKKSTVLEKLCPEFSWFADGLSDFGSKAQAEEVEGKWIIELGEMKGFDRELDQIKSFVTRRAENYRPAYARHSIHSPRKCVFAATVNPSAAGYLRDVTGNRRYWPIKCLKKAPPITPEIRDRLWSEALALYKAGEIWWIDDDDPVLDLAKEEQKSRVEVDVWHEKIVAGVAGHRDTSTSEILTDIIKMDVSKQGRADQARVGRIMMMLEWKRYQTPPSQGRQWRFRNPVYEEQAALF